MISTCSEKCKALNGDVDIFDIILQVLMSDITLTLPNFVNDKYWTFLWANL